MIHGMKTEKILIIDNVRSAHNVGSMFRTSDGAGVTRIILVGYTPAPVDRFGRAQAEIVKTSLGASAMIPWEQKGNREEVLSLINGLKQEGFVVVAVEQTPTSVSLYDFPVPEKVAYIVGNEIDGVSEELLAVSDVVVDIPMAGKKESLNVGVATGIVLFYR
jgi:tRNA G18 (ribose-2'-O)-methylase SpoU